MILESTDSFLSRIDSSQSLSCLIPRACDSHVVKHDAKRANGVVPNDALCVESLTEGPSTLDWYLLVFSAHNKKTLEANIRAIHEASSNTDIVNLAHTQSCRRSTFSERCYAVASDTSLKIDSVLDVQATKRVVSTKVPKLAFVFSGKVSLLQYFTMPPDS